MEAGQPYPLGAIPDASGVNFALFSENATGVELCLFDAGGGREIARVPLEHRSDDVWHGHIGGLGAGQLYGYRVHGPYAPREGHRFNAHKLLVDPYARELRGELRHDEAIYGFVRGHADADLSFDTRDSAPFVPKCVVREDSPARGGDVRGERDTVARAERGRPGRDVIYETHVRNLTMQFPGVPAERRGTYAALASRPVLRHLEALGVGTVELLPVHAMVDDHFLVDKGLVNHWGYNTLAFLAPATRYALGDPVREFRDAVRALHRAGFEVMLDVVYNHTCEGSELGPTLCYRGIDNAAYYRLAPDRRHYIDDTGCGNTVAVEHPRVLQLIMDSLRFWAREMRVDGFRFDLASALGREAHGFDRGAGFFDAVRQDPHLAGTRLVAEPWDIGPGGYQLGQYPVGWSEWNDRFRDTVRRFWAGEEGLLGELSKRLLGSSDLFEWQRRGPRASINFVTAHDGFTLADLVTYERKHNEANGEGNRDGHGDNHSFNHGVEGPSDDPAVRAARSRTARNLLATLLLSQGTPMMLAGDEVGASQSGNNNAYCQDNPIGWIDWHARTADRELEDFAQALLALRAAEPVLRRERFLHGRVRSPSSGLPDASWLNAAGESMHEEDWRDRRAFLALQLVGDAVLGPSEAEGATLLLLFNGGGETVRFPLGGEALCRGKWQVVLDTAGLPRPVSGPDSGNEEGTSRESVPGDAERSGGAEGSDELTIESRSVVVARCVRGS